MCNEVVTKGKGRQRTLWILVAFFLMITLGSGCVKEKVYHVGILSGLDYVLAISDGFKAQMEKLGYIEGENIIYDLRRSNVNLDEYEDILQDFNSERVDLIFCYPTEAAIAAKKATVDSKIPVIFDFANIEGNDIVDSIRKPGGNVTGVRYPGPGIAIKRFEVMMELAPDTKRMLIPYQKGAPTVPAQMELLYPAAKEAGVVLIEAPATDARELDEFLQALVRAGDDDFDAILFLAEPLTVLPEAFAVISNFAAKRRIPIGGAIMTHGNYGSVFGVNTELMASGGQAAFLADKVLKGADPGTLPVLSAEIFIQINYRMIQELGLNINEGLLSQAHEIIR